MAEPDNDDQTNYPSEFEKSLNPEVIRTLREQNFEKGKEDAGKNILDIAAGFIPVLGLLKSRTSFQSYKDWKMGNKMLAFFENFASKDYDPDQLRKMMEDIQDLNQESFFETLIDTIDRIDNHNKASILSNILHHSINGDISRENFLRHSWILANIPYIDLRQLHNYTQDFYQPASSEMLASNGLIIETVIDEGVYDVESTGQDGGGGIKYGLSPLGEEMLRFGMYNIDWKYKGNGRVISQLQWHEGE